MNSIGPASTTHENKLVRMPSKLGELECSRRNPMVFYQYYKLNRAEANIANRIRKGKLRGWKQGGFGIYEEEREGNWQAGMTRDNVDNLNLNDGLGQSTQPSMISLDGEGYYNSTSLLRCRGPCMGHKTHVQLTRRWYLHFRGRGLFFHQTRSSTNPV
jgi:hypothetical protein